MFSRRRKIAAHITNDIVYIMVVDKRKASFKINILNKTSLNQQNLSRFCTENNLLNQRVSLSIENKNIITQVMQLPLLPQKEIKKALVWEFVKNIPLNPEDIIVDYLVIEKTDSAIKLLVFAVQKSYVEKICDLFFSAGLKPELVEIDGLLLPYLIEKTFPEQDLQDPTYILFKNDDKIIINFLLKNKTHYLFSINTKENILDKIKILNTHINSQYKEINAPILYLVGKQIDHLSEIKEILKINKIYQINKLPNNFIFSEEMASMDPNYFFPCGLLLRK